MTGHEWKYGDMAPDLVAMETWANPMLNRLLESATTEAVRKPIDAADLLRGCSDCGVMLLDGDMCGHCERTHIRRAVERHGANSGVCGTCATEAGTLAARTGADVGELYDDVLRRKAGLPAQCEPEKAGALDVELCDEPVKAADPVWALPDDVLTDTSEWKVLPMASGPIIGPEDTLDAAMARHPAGSKRRDVDEELDTIKAVRLSIACLLLYPRGPGSAALLHAFDRRLEQLEAAALAKGGQQ